MAGLIFNEYVVSKVFYENNQQFDISTEMFEVNPKFSAEIHIAQNNAIVELGVEVGDLTSVSSPFYSNVVIKGMFEYNNEESENLTFEDYLIKNAIAILFPYIRNILSDITLKSNQFPAYILPVMNVAKMIEDQGNLKIIKNEQ